MYRTLPPFTLSLVATMVLAGCSSASIPAAFSATPSITTSTGASPRPSETAPVYVGRAPMAVAVSSDGSTLYIPITDGIAVVDNASGKVTTTPMEKTPGSSGWVLSPDGRTIYSSSASTGKISSIDLKSGRVTQLAELMDIPSVDAVSRDGSTLYIGNLGRLEILDIVTGETKTLRLGLVPEDEMQGSRIALSPDGEYAYVTNPASKELFWVDLAIGKATESSLVPFGASQVTVSPDSTMIYVAGTDPKTMAGFVGLIDPSTGDDQWIPLADAATSLSISPDGSALFLIAGTSQKRVLILDPENGEVMRTIDLGGLNAWGAVDPSAPRYYAVTMETGALTIVTYP